MGAIALRGTSLGAMYNKVLDERKIKTCKFGSTKWLLSQLLKWEIYQILGLDRIIRSFSPSTRGNVQQILDERKIKTCKFGSTKWFWIELFDPSLLPLRAMYNKFWMKEKSKHANLAQQNGFVSAIEMGDISNTRIG